MIVDTLFPRFGGSQITASWAEQGLAVAAAEQEDEAFQVAAKFVQAVGGVADELRPGALRMRRRPAYEVIRTRLPSGTRDRMCSAAAGTRTQP